MSSRGGIVLLMGVSGAGKTAVGQRLADRLGWSFVDADDLHPAANVARMKAGVPLTDEDRLPWLLSVRAAMVEHAESGRSLVVACSALKHAYRELLFEGPEKQTGRQTGQDEGKREGTGESEAPGGRVETRLVYLRAAPEVLERRLRERRGHFFDPGLLASQLETLEEPTGEESSEALVVDADEELEAVVDAVAAVLGLPAGGGPSAGEDR